MKKILVLILAYNAEKHIVGVLNRLPAGLWQNSEYTTEVVVIDDCSQDNTSQVARAHFSGFLHPVHLLRNAVNQGYGGNQKIGYTYAVQQGFDAVVMLHGDGQYPPEKIPDMVAPLIRGEADAVFGSRMLHKKDALAGGMPLYKFIGNMVLTAIQNAMLGSRLSEFHSGFRAYSVAALRQIPFQCNSNVFHFDTDIIIQLVDKGLTIREIPIPTHYGDEICRVNGPRYALDVMLSTLLSRVQKLGIFYAPKFDYEQTVVYFDKTDFASNHRFALDRIPPGASVLDISCDGGVLTPYLRAKGCGITYCGADLSDKNRAKYDAAHAMDLNNPDFTVLGNEHYDVVLLLDVISHITAPERFLAALHAWSSPEKQQVIVTTSNIAFFIQRIMLFIGQFNYGKRGTLDMTHTRLFTTSSLKRILVNAGFNLVELEGIPAPFPLAVGKNTLGRGLIKLNGWLITLSKSLFSYQIAAIAKPRPTLEWLVVQAMKEGAQVT